MAEICQDELVAVRRCRGGSPQAFEALVNRYMKDAYCIALGLVGNREDALDLSQEAFVRAYRNIRTLRPDHRFFPWFYQILKNLCISHLRKAKLRHASSLDAEDCPEVEARQGLFSPDVVADRNEMRDKLWQAIGKLEEKHREVIILRHFQNLSYEQMADALFCNVGTVTSRLYYARQRLKELLSSEKGGCASGL